MNETLVSIIIPTYARPANLKRAINSCLIQSYQNFEIIVIDDNNSNTEYRAETELLMNNFEDKRIIYIKHDHNRNGAAARNTGIKVSKGNYIAFLDDDDVFLPTKIEEQVRFLEKMPADYGGCYCGYSFKYKKWYLGNSPSPLQEGDLEYELLAGKFSFGTSSTLLIKKEVVIELNGFDESFIRHQDIEFVARMLSKYKIGAISDRLLVKHEEDFLNRPSSLSLKKTKEHFLNTFRNRIISYSKEKQVEIYDFHNLEMIKYYLIDSNYKLAFNTFRKISFINFGNLLMLSLYLFKLSSFYRGIKIIRHNGFKALL